MQMSHRSFDQDRFCAHSASAVAFHSGIAAEELVAEHYRAEGGRVRSTRWRCPEGELDLVVELGDELVFVEVKARRAHAPDAVSAKQWARIGAAASRYLAETTDGSRACRFDLALVDRSGRTERIENARGYDGW
ncbi:MAG: YraN family protein [Amaricoccus sp.]